MKNVLKSKLLAAGSLVLASGSAFADTAEAISGAVATGTTNYTAVIAGVVTIAALGFCIGLILRRLSN